MASLASAPPAAAQSGPAEPGLLSRTSSWVTAQSSWLAGEVAGWFAEEPKGEIRPAQAPITLPGRDGTPAQLKLDPVKEPGKRVKELTEQRTAVSKTFELEDGRRQVEISAVRQHVRDESGTWRPVETRVREQAEDGFTLAAERTGYVARFGERSDRLVRVGLGEAQVTFGLPGEPRTIKPEVDGAKVTYRGAFGEGADLVYEVTASGVKEGIVLARAPQGTPSYQFTVSMSGGLQAKANPDGSIGFVPPSGKGAVFTIPKPYMIDTADDAASPYGKRFSAAVTQTLGEQSTLTVTPDAGWLAAPERSWPVTIDPTVVIAPDWSTSSDAMIVSTSPTTNYDVDLRLSVGRSGTSVYRGLVRFDLAGLVPEGTTIDKAEMGLYYDQTLAGSTGSVALEARRVTQPWDPSTVTWNSINTAMGEVAATATFQAAQANLWHTYTVTDLARAWLAGTTPNHGVMVKAVNETVAAGGPQYAEGEWAKGFPENPMPKLTLTYGTPSVQLGRPLVVHATGAELAWKPYDGPGEVTEYQIHRSRDLSFTPSPATLVAPLDSKATTYVDTSATPNTKVAYQVVAVRSAGQASTSGPLIVELPNAGITAATIPPSADTTLTSCQPSVGHDKLGERANLSAGFGGTAFGTTRALLKFDTSIIPAGIKEVMANLRIFQVAHRGLEPSYHFYPLTRSFDEATASWQQAAPGVPWTKAGGDHETASVGQGFFTSPTDPDFSSWWAPRGFDALAQRWISDPSTNHGLLLRADSESSKACPTSGDGDSFTSSEAAEPEVRPWLHVLYYDPTQTYSAPSTRPGWPAASSGRSTSRSPTPPARPGRPAPPGWATSGNCRTART